TSYMPELPGLETEPINVEPVDAFDPRHAEAIDGLLWLGKLTDSFHMFGHRFTLKTLTRGERLAVTQVARDYADTLGASMALETAVVAACVVSVDNRPLNPDLGPNMDPVDRVAANFAVVQDWYDVVLEQIYERYSQLLIRQVQAFIELE